jgi:hypothetical protein
MPLSHSGVLPPVVLKIEKSGTLPTYSFLRLFGI